MMSSNSAEELCYHIVGTRKDKIIFHKVITGDLNRALKISENMAITGFGKASCYSVYTEAEYRQLITDINEKGKCKTCRRNDCQIKHLLNYNCKANGCWLAIKEENKE